MPTLLHFDYRPIVGRVITDEDGIEPLFDAVAQEASRIRAEFLSATGAKSQKVHGPKAVAWRASNSFGVEQICYRVVVPQVVAKRDSRTGKLIALRPEMSGWSGLSYPWFQIERFNDEPGETFYPSKNQRADFVNPEAIDKFFGVQDFTTYKPVTGQYKLPLIERQNFAILHSVRHYQDHYILMIRSIEAN